VGLLRTTSRRFSFDFINGLVLLLACCIIDILSFAYYCNYCHIFFILQDASTEFQTNEEIYIKCTTLKCSFKSEICCLDFARSIIVITHFVI